MTYKKLQEMIEEHNVEYVDFRFTDPHGVWHHMTLHVAVVDEGVITDGVMFDGSSIPGWKAINESDMILMPDVSTVVLDPFATQPMLIVFCDVYDPTTGMGYERCPRGIARAALNYSNQQGYGDSVSVGSEAEFFVFDDVRWKVRQDEVAFRLGSEESPHSSNDELPQGNMGHRPGLKGGYVPCPPVDSGHDLRAEMVSTMMEMGLPMEKHHHEVAPSQHELGMRFSGLLENADQVQIYKYVVKNVAYSYGKTATFMPKPVVGDNGSGMHTHISLWKSGKNTFAGNQYADLSDSCLYFIGGIIKHAKTLNAFTNPTTNSYKRLVPGFEAPVLLAYSSRNRSASCRIPYSSSVSGKRVEIRFPDPMANPYLAFTALLMAGLDGIENRLHPGDAMDKDLYDLPKQELVNIPTVAGSLREALESLESDHAFLLKGDVMNKDFIDSYAELKWQEVEAFEQTTHPLEFEMYYSR